MEAILDLVEKGISSLDKLDLIDTFSYAHFSDSEINSMYEKCDFSLEQQTSYF
jgi:hypothetical protein